MTGRIAVNKGVGKPIEIQEAPVPDPLPGDLVLRMTQAGICGSDLHLWRGDTQYPTPPEGSAMGHEGCGIVHSLGEGVRTDALGQPLREGDRVVPVYLDPCERCGLCLDGWPNLCVNRYQNRTALHEFPHFTGTFADYHYVTSNRAVFKVPDGLPDTVLGPVNCAMGTVTQGLISAGVRAGQSVVIQGAGGLGVFSTAMAKEMGADPVIVLDRLEPRLALAREFGADHTLNIDAYDSAEARIERVRELCGRHGADVVVELVGIPELLPEGVAMLRNAGTFVEIGLFFEGRSIAFDPATITLSAKRLIGSAMYQPRVLAQVLQFMAQRQDDVPFHKLISHRFALDDINGAFAASEWERGDTSVSRAVIEP